MTTRFTKELRQEIVRNFALAHNGFYNPSVFLEEVRQTGESHPAWAWFEWDEGRAALAYNLERARAFAQGLKVRFEIADVEHGPVTVSAPLVLSAFEGRRMGVGYHLFDTEKPANDMTELCRQAAVDLAAWLRRYDAAIRFVGGSIEFLHRELRLLEAVSEKKEEGAA